MRTGNKILLTSSHGHRLLVLSQGHEELRLGQLLIGRHGGQQRRFDHFIGGGGGRGSTVCGGGHGGGHRDLAELPGEGWRAEAAIRLQAHASILTQQRAEDCRGAESSDVSLGATPWTLLNNSEQITAERWMVGLFTCAHQGLVTTFWQWNTPLKPVYTNNTALSKKYTPPNCLIGRTMRAACHKFIPVVTCFPLWHSETKTRTWKLCSIIYWKSEVLTFFKQPSF